MISMEPAKMTIDGTTYTAELAVIESTHLGYEDHGIGTVMLDFEGPGWRQSNDPRCLTEYDKERKRQTGTAYGFDFIFRILDTIGVDRWEHVKGQRVYVLRESPFGRIEGIANTDQKRCLIFDAHHREFFPDES